MNRQKIRKLISPNFKKGIGLLLLVATLFFVFPNFISAQVSNSPVVSASIPDHFAPSTPILIAPSDGANIDHAYPAFQWYESTDDMGMSHYEFWLDGSLEIDNLPLNDMASGEYSLDYDPGTGVYTMVLTSAIAHGSHNWKIVAVDYADNSAASDIWDFNIFTEDPEFTVTKIGDVNTSISATNPSSVPSSPILIFNGDGSSNEPWIIASGDPSVDVDLTVTIPDDPTQYFSQATGTDGSWSLQLGILPRDENIRLDFLVTDVVGHTSQITALYIKIYQQYIPATDTPTPTSTPTSTPTTTSTPTSTLTTTTWPTTTTSLSPSPSLSVTASPSASPTATISASLTPTIPPPSLAPSGIRVPVVPPREIVHEGAQELVERLPKKIADFLTYLFSSAFWKKIAPGFAFFLALLAPLLAYILLLTKFMDQFSTSLLKKAFWALWPFSKDKKNLVFAQRSNKASPLVKVELIAVDSGQILDYQITNYFGNFSDFGWPSNRQLRLRVKDKNFYYPIGDAKPQQLYWQSFYQDEIFQFDNQLQGSLKQLSKQSSYLDSRRAILIPTLTAQSDAKLPFWEQARIILAYLVTYPPIFYILSFIPVSLIAIRYPSIVNNLSLLYYLAILLIKFYQRIGTAGLKLIVETSSGQKPDRNLIVAYNDLKTGQSKAMTVALDLGQSQNLRLLKNEYLMLSFANVYSLWEGDHALTEQRLVLEADTQVNLQINRVEGLANNLEYLSPASKL